MSRELEGIELGIKIHGENSDSGPSIIKGAGAPAGGGLQDDAEKASLYIDETNAKVYQKHTAGAGAGNWAEVPFLSAGYTAASGDPVALEGFEATIAKLDGNIDALETVLGVSQGDTDLGTFTGGIVTDNASVRTVVQDLINYINNIIDDQNSADGVTAVTVIDSELCDEFLAVEYLITISLNSAPAQRKMMRVTMFHDGHAGADATDAKDSITSVKRFGASFNADVDSDVSGVGAAQVMNLKVTSSEIGGVDVRCKAVAKVKA
jgi:hypothetical protein